MKTSSSWRLERFMSSGMLHCANEHTVRKPQESSNESKVLRESLTLKRRPCDLLNGYKLFTNQQVTFQKTWIFCNITARTSNLQLKSCSAVSLTTGCCIQLQQKWASFQTHLMYLLKSVGIRTFTTIPVNQNVIHTVTHSHLRAMENLFFVTYMSDK